MIYFYTFCFLESGNNATRHTNGSIVAPCVNGGSDFTFKYLHNYGRWSDKLQGCCDVFKTLFDRSHVEQIMTIMHHTIGTPLPFGGSNDEGATDRNIFLKFTPDQEQL